MWSFVRYATLLIVVCLIATTSAAIKAQRKTASSPPDPETSVDFGAILLRGLDCVHCRRSLLMQPMDEHLGERSPELLRPLRRQGCQVMERVCADESHRLLDHRGELVGDHATYICLNGQWRHLESKLDAPVHGCFRTS